MPMYVISNGELAREALNAVVTLLRTNTFVTAIKISVLFSILAAALSYIRGRDIVIFARWFVIYFGITTIMLGPKVTLQIMDSSNPGRADLTVANVPYGLGYPASLITTISHGLVAAFEEAFHMPDDFAYNKTGMLFGSKLFRLSTEFHLVNPDVRLELNEYVKNCVLGDILINKKYSMAELTESRDLFNTITKTPSNIRGIYVAGVFKTCLAATGEIKKHIEEDIKVNLFTTIGKQLYSVFGKVNEKKAAERLENSLRAVYELFDYGSLSSSALQIATQNVLINGIRDGVLNYTAESGATASLALLNLSTSQAMDRMRMSLATSRNIATYTIPVMHTVLLLLMLGLFPVMVFLAFQPNLTAQVLKNYFYTLVWIESWPLMFACLNLIVTFYTKSSTGQTSFTMSNIDQLALEHSDVANMAGYLMLSIPFISGGLVKGMSSAFNTAANYIGGVLQSSASSAASEAASGNIHLGNSSWNNVNANKFDTNTSMMHGMATEQLKTGVLRTTRPDGETTYDASHAISKLPTSVRSSDLLSSSFSEQAETARTASVQDQKAYDQSISHAVSDFSSLGKSLSSGTSIGESLSSRESVSAGQSFSDMKNIAENVAKRNHVGVDDVFRELVTSSQRAQLGGKISASWSTPGAKVTGIGAGVDGSLDGHLAREHLVGKESSTRHDIGRSFDVTAEEAKRFSSDLHKVEEYSKTSHADTNHSTAASQLSQLSTDLRNARSASEQYSVHKAESERLSNAASYVRQHSGQIDSDLSQEVANYVVERVGLEEAETLFAGKDRVKLEALSKEYISNSGIESSIMSRYQNDSSGVNPDHKYQSGETNIDAEANSFNFIHEKNKQIIDSDAKDEGVGVDQQQYSKLVDNIEAKNKAITKNINGAKLTQDGAYNEMKNEITKNINEGASKATSKVGKFVNTKPAFLNHNKK